MSRTYRNILIIIFAVILCIGAVIASFFIKNQANAGQFEVKTGYVCGGTIPIDAKIYPVVDENLYMTVNDADGVLSSEDIWTITNYVDKWATCNDTRGNGFDEDSVSEFVSSERLDEVREILEDCAYDFLVEGTQILSIEVSDDGIVDVEYLVQMTGCNESNGMEEATYDAVHGLKFKKVNGNWYENGVGFNFIEKADLLTWSQDAITGVVTASYITTYD